MQTEQTGQRGAIRRTLSLGGRIVVVVSFFVGVFGVLQWDLNRHLTDVAEDVQVGLHLATGNTGSISEAAHRLAVAERDIGELRRAVGTRLAVAPDDLMDDVVTNLDAARIALAAVVPERESTVTVHRAATASLAQFTDATTESVTVIRRYGEGSPAEQAGLLDDLVRTDLDRVKAQTEVDKDFAALTIQLDAQSVHFIDHVTADSVDLVAAASRLTWISVVLAFVLGLYLAITFTRASRRISSAVTTMAQHDLPMLVDVTEALGRGDLTKRVALRTSKIEDRSADEFGVIASEVNSMVDQLHAVAGSLQDATSSLGSLIGESRAFTDQVQSESEFLATGAKESAQAAAEVAGAITGVADGSTNQAIATDEMASAVNEITSVLQGASTGIEDVYQASAAASSKAEAGQEVADAVRGEMGHITRSFDRVTEFVTDLDNQSRQIGDIVQLIHNIAAQTNLLALNAAIEAARAGEFGRGFAVVASEVKGLSEEATASTEQIKAIVGEMRQGVSEVVAAAVDGNQIVSDGAEAVQRASAAFESIVDSVQTITSEVTGLRDFTDVINGATAKISEHSVRLVTIAEANSASGEEVAAASEQAAASSQEIGVTAANLAETARTLRTSMAHFALPEADAAGSED